MRFNQVNPEKFVEPLHGKPANGRGAWTRTGIGFDYRYMINPETQPRIGTVCERSLDHWAVGAGTWAIQSRLIALEYLPPIANAEWGIFGPKTEAAVSTFQQGNLDPAGKGVRLAVDGTVGRSDARALFTPLIKVAQADYHIPDDLLLGETNHESRLDPGALVLHLLRLDPGLPGRGPGDVPDQLQGQRRYLLGPGLRPGVLPGVVGKAAARVPRHVRGPVPGPAPAGALGRRRVRPQQPERGDHLGSHRQSSDRDGCRLCQRGQGGSVLTVGDSQGISVKLFPY
jgi:peptidoglycan hydrolase-like protein with peptidoglycan-binding domain